MAWPRRDRDPALGTCDDGWLVECCTSADGMTDCHLTDVGTYTPFLRHGAALLLAQTIPDDETEAGTLDRLIESAKNIPSPLEFLEDTRKRLEENVETLGGALKPELTIGNPNINVQLPESLGFAALLPVALLGLVVGGGIALAVKK